MDIICISNLSLYNTMKQRILSIDIGKSNPGFALFEVDLDEENPDRSSTSSYVRNKSNTPQYDRLIENKIKLITLEKSSFLDTFSFPCQAKTTLNKPCSHRGVYVCHSTGHIYCRQHSNTVSNQNNEWHWSSLPPSDKPWKMVCGHCVGTHKKAYWYYYLSKENAIPIGLCSRHAKKYSSTHTIYPLIDGHSQRHMDLNGKVIDVLNTLRDDGWFSPLHHVVIEQQAKKFHGQQGASQPIIRDIGQMVFSYFCHLQRDTNKEWSHLSIHRVGASGKLTLSKWFQQTQTTYSQSNEQIITEKKRTATLQHTKNKKDGIGLARQFLQRFHPSMVSQFEMNSSKLDDKADAYLQGLWFIIHKIT